MFQNNLWKLSKLFETALSLASRNEIKELLQTRNSDIEMPFIFDDFIF